MNDSKIVEDFGNAFLINLPHSLIVNNNSVERLLLREYGAVLVAKGGSVVPETIVFRDESEVSAFQSTLQISAENLGGYDIELQTPAMKALLNAVSEATSKNLTITPRGTDSARRNYAETVTLWASRVEPALKHWVEKGRITLSNVERINGLSPFDQVAEILKLEEKKIFFSKDLSKSIIYSVAPPGTSQHLTMLALDIAEHGDVSVRNILTNNSWYQTVISDLPHFTFLGIKENELENSGLNLVVDKGRKFWIPLARAF